MLDLRSRLSRPLHPHAWTVWLLLTPIAVGACLFFDFVPREGPDGAYRLGWPLVVAEYAPREGLRLRGWAWPTFLVQILLYAAATGVVAVRQRFADAARAPIRGDGEPE